jgi:hypothetical protein
MFSPRRALAALSLLTLAGTVSPALANNTPATDGEDAAQRGFTNPNIKRMSKLPRNTDVTKVAKPSPSKTARVAAPASASPRSSVQATAAKRISIVGENTVAALEQQRQAAAAKPKANNSLAMQQRTITRQSSVAQRVSQQVSQTKVVTPKVVTQSSLSLAQNREVTNSSTKVREGKAIGRTSTEIRENSTVTRSTKVSREMRSSPTSSPTVMRVAPAPAPQQNAAVPGKGTRKLASAARKATPKPAAKTAAASSQAKA